MRRSLRLLPLGVLTLGLTWSGVSASADEAQPPEVEEVAAAVLPPRVDADAPPVALDRDFAFSNVRRF